MDKSEKLDQLVPALIAAQKAFRPVVKDSDNPFFHSKYASLEQCVECTKEALWANGLTIVQHFAQAMTEKNETYLPAFSHVTSGKDAKGQDFKQDIGCPAVTLQTTLLHVSGQWIGGSQTLTPAKPDPQGFKAAATYARRSALLAILGIAEEDDDGNAASQPVRGGKGETAWSRPGVAKPALEPAGGASADDPGNIDFDSLPSSTGVSGANAGAKTLYGASGDVEFTLTCPKPGHQDGKGARGPWQRWFLKVTEAGDYGSTFDLHAGAFLDSNIGKSIVLSCNKSERGYDIVGWGLA